MIGSSLTETLASGFAGLALSHLTREYPNKLDQVLHGKADLLPPRELHPVFFGSFDWHSCVHGYWLLATVVRLFPKIEHSAAINDLLDRQLTPAKVKGELAYMARAAPTFERPYGWAWLLMLAAELNRHDSERGNQWSEAVSPLADAFSERFQNFLPKATYPTRVGTHFNSAFAITLALEYSEVCSRDSLRETLVAKAKAWFRHDVDCQAWEPGGDDFLSSALMEAECMRRVLTPVGFSSWLDRFLPRLAVKEPASLFTPATVSDRSDGKIAHLDGLNLSRAWCWRSIAQSWPDSDPRKAIAQEAAEEHLAASLPHVSGDYMGEHWLATFALLAVL
ncbi:MAG TPA: DUF2891 domain-containing protein [Gemmatimonadaceae bacterium]|nr:DUF2891 domain-containing protein [Gemmatimonadaceae bacterium]